MTDGPLSCGSSPPTATPPPPGTVAETAVQPAASPAALLPLTALAAAASAVAYAVGRYTGRPAPPRRLLDTEAVAMAAGSGGVCAAVGASDEVRRGRGARGTGAPGTFLMRSEMAPMEPPVPAVCNLTGWGFDTGQQTGGQSKMQMQESQARVIQWFNGRDCAQIQFIGSRASMQRIPSVWNCVAGPCVPLHPMTPCRFAEAVSRRTAMQGASRGVP